MLTLSNKLMTYLKRANVKIAALVGIVTSVLSDEQQTEADWNAGALDGTPGTDFPMTTLGAQLNAGATSMTVVTTAGFSVGAASSHEGYLAIVDGANVEIVKYTSSTGTTFTGLTRGQYGTTDRTNVIGSYVFQLIPSHGTSPDYNLSINEKNWMHPATPTGGPPSARMGAKMVWVPLPYGGKFYLFGGYDGTNYKNDIWSYAPATNTWAQLTTTGGPPAVRAYHVMTYMGGGIIVVVGGKNATGNLQDTWEFNVTNNAWAAGVNCPMVVHSAMAAAYDIVNPKMVMAGGINQIGDMVRNVYTYNRTLWVPVVTNATFMAYGDACFMGNEGIVFFVGVNDSGFMITQYWNPQNSQWYTPSSPPSRKYYPSLSYDDVNHVPLMFGGESALFSGAGWGSKDVYSWSAITGLWSAHSQYSRENRTRHVAGWDDIRKQMFSWGGAVNSVTLTWPTYTIPMFYRYFWATSKYITATIDLITIPTESGFWILDDTYDSNHNYNGRSYTAAYSDNNINYTSIGAITDGLEITDLHRYWKVHVIMTNAGLNSSPQTMRIDACYDHLDWFSLASRPVDNYEPLIKNISTLTSEIDLIKYTAKIGSVKIDFDNTSKLAQRIVTNAYIRNKTVKIKLGVLEDDFSVNDFVSVLKGRVKDWTYSNNVLNLNIIDFLGDTKLDIPKEDILPPHTITPLVYNNGGICSNPVDIILDILQNQVNIADRDLDLDSFAAVKASSSISGWKFNRTIADPTDAYEMCIEICRHIGAALIPRENGKLALKMLDTIGDPVESWNELNQSFNKPSFNAEGSSIRNWISTWYGWDGEGDKYTDYSLGGIEVVTDADSIAHWGMTIIRTKSKWLGIQDTPPVYQGQTLALAISTRICALSKWGVPTISVETNMSSLQAQVGDIVRVRSAIVDSFDEYLNWQSIYDAKKTLDFPDKSGRYSIPWLTYDCDECVDMKFWITKKQVNFVKGTIKWELARARTIPLTKTYDTQAEWYLGYGENIDLETTPNSVLLAIETGTNYYASGWGTIIMDMSQQPEQDGEWTLTDAHPGNSSVVYQAWASETGHFQGEEIPLGTITNALAITIKTRYYKVKATLTASSDLQSTPSITLIKANFPYG